MDSLWIAIGAALLYVGAEALVRGATALARALGVSPLIVGLTVVSFGTSSPELASSLAAAFADAPDVAFGNVVGSNIANVGLILGLTALIWPLRGASRGLRHDIHFMLLASLLLFPVVYDHHIGRLEGAALLILLVGYLLVLSRRGDSRVEIEAADGDVSRGRSVALALLGLVLLVAGARSLVAGAVGVAHSLGISERVVGLTMVALGTSLPELASCLVAALRREGDLVLGNIIGSNIFNILAILGTTAAVHPIAVGPAWIDLLVMLALSAATWPFLVARRRLLRLEGGVLLAGYLAYVVWLFL